LLSKLIFNSPWYYVFFSIVAALLLSALLYFRNKKNSEIPHRILKFMFAIRLITISLLLLLLLNIFLKIVRNETQAPLIVLAIDNSASVLAGSDSTFIRQEFQQQISSFREQIAENFEVKTLLFGSKVSAAELPPDFREKETDLQQLLSDVENNYANQNVGALVILSDGIYNKGANPVYGSEKLGYPIYTVAMGDTNETKDVSVQKINHNQFAYLGNVFPVEAVIQAKQFNGEEINVTILNNGITRGEQKLKINSDNFTSTVNFTLSADVGGVQRYSVKVSTLKGEKNISNNAQTFIIDVIDNRYKVLLLANFPHPDVGAIKEVVSENPAYELKFFMTEDFKESVKPYSLVIFHGYSNNQAGLISDCKNNNVPFWIVNPNTTDQLEGLKISASFNKHNDAEPALNTTFGLFNISTELRKFINDLPAIKTVFGNYALSSGANVLLNQKIGVIETENPILLFSENSGLKTAVFVGDGLWRWKMRDFAEHNNVNLFTELVGKSIQYLSVKGDKSFFRINAPKIINENEQFEIGAEVYNKSYELISEPSASLTLTNPEKKVSQFNFGKIDKAYKLNLGYLTAGEYKYEARVNVSGELFTKNGTLVVKEVVSEKINTVANHQLLYQLSNRTGGKLFYPAEIMKMRDELLKNQYIKPITYSSNQTTLLIDLRWIFFIILSLLSVEWFFRKRYAVI
jgi:hypothetical protein